MINPRVQASHYLPKDLKIQRERGSYTIGQPIDPDR